MVVPLFGGGVRDYLPFGVAFPTMLAVVVGGTLAAVWAHRGRIEKPWRRAAEISVSIAVVLLLGPGALFA